MSPVRAFATVFMAVFLFIFCGSALVTFMMPDVYTATARVFAHGAGNQQLFLSSELLKEVSQQLKLPGALAARYGDNKPWDETRVEDMLRRSVRVVPVRGTELLGIRVHGPSPEDCTQLANQIAEAGVRRGKDATRIVELATRPTKPSRPNKPFNLALGALVGVFLGTMAGGVGAKLAVGFMGQTPSGS